MSSTEHFYSLNRFLREAHGSKVIKLSIDGGFTCPNRDGKLSTKGCLFCSAEGSGDFTPSAQLSITQQLHSALDLVSKKWPQSTKYIAYFQSYTNTYAPLATLKAKYEEALAFPQLVGLAIATRPDCLEDETVAYLQELSTRTHLWIELGLQTSNEASARQMNRGYTLDCFKDAVFKLASYGIEVVAHLIIGLPGETLEDYLATARFIGQLPLQGVKIHMLHILDDSPLGRIYQKNPFPLLTEEEYIFAVGEILKLLPSHFVIHRLTGDGAGDHLLAPLWTRNKKQVLNHLNHYLKLHDIYQGKF
ncbi:TIGR01212 family radical SAM protein [Sporanaerobium hydrogeniformans]|uniref:TIGR01212 family radical SAM protein n=1 Tax=Sporanaerobium hydrogeniformans TaxID=3072179 RepID=A0AC61DC72_9FIRM|nr:TIGR01212 family radical SAM protein [Sporanaerobium hydrogeniformans]PHV70343.1 TIGR01212 family radical SAM protein [Sporanaerobium hydrogeniformans]